MKLKQHKNVSMKSKSYVIGVLMFVYLGLTFIYTFVYYLNYGIGPLVFGRGIGYSMSLIQSCIFLIISLFYLILGFIFINRSGHWSRRIVGIAGTESEFSNFQIIALLRLLFCLWGLLYLSRALSPFLDLATVIIFIPHLITEFLVNQKAPELYRRSTQAWIQFFVGSVSVFYAFYLIYGAPLIMHYIVKHTKILSFSKKGESIELS